MSRFCYSVIFCLIPSIALSCSSPKSNDYRVNYKSSYTKFNELFKNNDVVFFGKITQSKKKPVHDYNGKYLYSRDYFVVEVKDVYKGKKIPANLKYWEQTSCLSHISVEVNKYYFFIANKSEDGNIIYVDVLDYLKNLGAGAFKGLKKPIKQYE